MLVSNVGKSNLVNRAYKYARMGAWTNFFGANAFAVGSTVASSNGASTLALGLSMCCGSNVAHMVDYVKVVKALRPEYKRIVNRARQIYSK